MSWRQVQETVTRLAFQDLIFENTWVYSNSYDLSIPVSPKKQGRQKWGRYLALLFWKVTIATRSYSEWEKEGMHDHNAE